MGSEALTSFIADYTDEVWNRGNVDAMNRYYSADYVHHDVSRPDVVSLNDYKEWARDLIRALGQLYVAADDLIADEASGMAVKRWTASGVHRAALAGFEPTGEKISFSGISIYRVSDRRIVESWYVYDLFGLVQQLQKQPAKELA